MMRSDAFVRVAVGPIGSGKSSACVVELVRRAFGQAPGPDGVRRSRFAVIRNTYRELQDTTRRTFEQWVGPEWGRWREQEFTFEIAQALEDGTRVESEILFRSLNRPEDVKKLLSLELTGAYLNEVREIPKAVFDTLQGRVGRYPSKMQGGCTWFGIWADTNPWHTGHWGAKLFRRPPEGFELYRQPGGREPNAENAENLPAGYYERLCLGKDAEWIRVYIDGQEGDSDRGSVFGLHLEQLDAKGGLEEFEHPRDGVFTSWDLGVSDATAIWFWRARGDGIDLIDWYEASGQNAQHFVEVVNQRGYAYARHFLPHDARARTFQTGISTVQILSEAWPGKVAITPELRLEDGLSAARWLLEQTTRFHPRCADGIERLREYRFEWDEDARAFSRRPLHDWTSHCFAGETRVLTRYGTQRIMDLPFSGEVLTPCGWKPYRNPRVSKRNAPLVGVVFDGGYTVRCTPDHLFLTVSGWKSAEHLLPGTLIQSSLIRSRRSLVAGSIGSFLRAPTSAIRHGCTAMFGKPPSVPSRATATSTIGTRTPPTTGSPILSASRLATTTDTQPRGVSPRAPSRPSLSGQESQPRNGTEARLEGCGTAATPNAARVGSNGSGLSGLVSFAAKRFLHWSGRVIGSVSAETTARPLRIAAVTRLTETADVWDLTVPEVECFSLENGAVVHNSADAFRYVACAARSGQMLAKPPPPQKPLVTHKPPTLDELWSQVRRPSGRIG